MELSKKARSTMIQKSLKVDKNAAYPKTTETLKAAQKLPETTELRQKKYLNNIIEQDHRAVKRLTKAGMGFKSTQLGER